MSLFERKQQKPWKVLTVHLGKKTILHVHCPCTMQLSFSELSICSRGRKENLESLGQINARICRYLSYWILPMTLFKLSILLSLWEMEWLLESPWCTRSSGMPWKELTALMSLAVGESLIYRHLSKFGCPQLRKDVPKIAVSFY